MNAQHPPLPQAAANPTGEAAPLVPAEVNLATFPWAPVRLDFFAGHPLALAQSGEAFRALVLLIVAAWRKVPAMSLPNEDRQLAAMAGHGRDVGAWQSMRNEVLDGWVLCTDGRWYHPEMSAWALQSWDAKLNREAFSAMQSARARSRRQSSEAHESAGEQSRGLAGAQPKYRRAEETRKDESKEHDIDNRRHQKETREEERKGEEDCTPHHDNLIDLPVMQGSDALVPLPQSGDLRKEANEGVGEADPVVMVHEHWKQSTGRPDEKLTSSRRRAVQKMLDEGTTPAEICDAIDGAVQDEFLQGRTAKSSRRLDTLEFICRSRDRILSLMSGSSRLASRAGATNHAALRTAESLLAAIEQARTIDIDAAPTSTPPTSTPPTSTPSTSTSSTSTSSTSIQLTSTTESI